MIEDDLPLKFKNATTGAGALTALAKEDLDPYSVEELAERIEGLESEITRVRDALDRKKNRLSAAEALFSFKGN